MKNLDTNIFHNFVKFYNNINKLKLKNQNK